MAFNIAELQLPHRITLQKLSTAIVDGGKQESWTTRTQNVMSLITEQSGNGPNGQTHTVTFGSRVNTESDIGTGDRILVQSGPEHLNGKYLNVESFTRHGVAGLCDTFVRCRCSQVLESWQPKG